MIPQALSRDAQLADIVRRVRDLESSPDLIGATITGSVFQTDFDDIGFKIKTDGIRQYDDTGTVKSSWTDDGIDLQGASIVSGSLATTTDDYGRRVGISTTGITIEDPSDIVGTGAGSIQVDEVDHLKMLVKFEQDDGSSHLDLSVGYLTLQATDDDSTSYMTVSAAAVLMNVTDGSTISRFTLTPGNLTITYLPTITGVSSNVYINPSTGALSRIT